MSVLEKEIFESQRIFFLTFFLRKEGPTLRQSPNHSDLVFSWDEVKTFQANFLDKISFKYYVLTCLEHIQLFNTQKSQLHHSLTVLTPIEGLSFRGNFVK